MKRTIGVLVCLALVVFSVAASGGSETKSTTGSSTTMTNVPAAYTLPLSKGGDTVTLTTRECYHPTKSFADILPIFQKYVEETGVQIKWETIKADYDTVMSTRLAAGQNLPDIIDVPGGSPDGWPKFIDGGLFLQLDDLILKYAPNIFKLYWKQRTDVRKEITYVDGKLYVLPTQLMGPEPGKSSNDYANPPGIIIRKDIFNELKIAEPTTIAEMYQALKTIKQAKPKMIGVTGWGDLSALGFFAHAYGVYQWEDFYPNKQGKVEYQWTRPEVKEWLTEMNKWYKEDLVDHDWLPDQVGPKSTRGDTAVFIGNNGIGWVMYAELKTNVPTAYFQYIMPLKGPRGDQLAPTYGFWNNALALTKSSKNPQLVIKWLDYCFYTERAFMDQMYGVPGLDYTVVDGKPKATQHFIDEGKKDGNYIYGQGAYVDTMMPQTYIKDYRMESYITFFNDVPDGQAGLVKTRKVGDMVYPRFPKMMPLAKEVDTLNQYLTDLTTYRSEMVLKFIKGDEPLSNWDAFVAQVKKLGVDELIKVKQAQYDRYNK
jgi:putative aldouronate transport system substrate-binding protein